MDRIARLTTDNKIEIIFNVYHDPFLLNEIRAFPSRSYDGHKKLWYMLNTALTLKFLQKWNFDIDPKILKSNLEKEKTLKINPKGLGLTPRGYQQEGMGFIEKHQGRVLIGDSAGLGKTLQAIGWMYYKKAYPALIVCPASLKINWEREVFNATGKQAQVIFGGPKTYKRKLNSDIVIINYDILKKWKVEIGKYKFKLMIVDESQFIKNYSANRTKACIDLSEKIPYCIALSATSIENSPLDLWATFKILNSELFPSYHRFAQHYSYGVKDQFSKGWKYKGARRTQELHSLLTDIMIRRKKEEVLKELPELQKIAVPMELANMAEYRKQEKLFVMDAKTDPDNKLSIMAKMEKLKQLIYKGKLKQLEEWIETYLESGEKLIVFGVHVDFVEKVFDMFEQKAVKLYGKMSSKAKQINIDSFQNDPEIRLMVANLDTGGVGLNLTAASATAIAEFPYNPAKLYQAESRIHRIGQKSKKVTSYNIIAVNTLEDSIIKTLDEKTKIRSAILDGREVSDKDLLTEILKDVFDRNR